MSYKLGEIDSHRVPGRIFDSNCKLVGNTCMFIKCNSSNTNNNNNKYVDSFATIYECILFLLFLYDVVVIMHMMSIFLLLLYHNCYCFCFICLLMIVIFPLSNIIIHTLFNDKQYRAKALMKVNLILIPP